MKQSSSHPSDKTRFEYTFTSKIPFFFSHFFNIFVLLHSEKCGGIEEGIKGVGEV
jgi:hypothetical protein